MTIRTFQPGDDAVQVAIYNETAAGLPKFKAATLDEVRRRVRAADFDPGTRFFADEGGPPVGYATFHANGRVSFPWCRPGHEAHAEALFEAVLQEMRRRGISAAFAAYRADWPAQRDFFLGHGFRAAREMVNFVLDLNDMPTPGSRAGAAVESLRPEDVPSVFALGEGVIRCRTPQELTAHLFHNPYFGGDSAVVLRGRAGRPPLAAAIVVADGTYADPRAVDANMPCFRLGAFGTEGTQWKRLNGVFSFVARPGGDLNPLGLEMLAHAASRLSGTAVCTLAAQVPSDAPHLLLFYQQIWRRQGAFPVYELAL
ncbi:MAG TPA: hypothetical protein VKA46_19670 [Gemmataceae bacterium]|nr:hypothetical protein [Gemmataceae bacterium]